MTSYVAQEIKYEGLQYENGFFTIAIDIGGSLAKVVYSPVGSQRLRFHSIETEQIDAFIQLIHSIIAESNGGQYSNVRIVATGGGSFKFFDYLSQEFRSVSQLMRFDEMECLIKGLDFFIHEIKDEVFTYNDTDGTTSVDSTGNNVYPYLLVNIGSGVSIQKVSSRDNFERIGGSSLGGGTLWGLLSLITGAGTYDQMLEWAQEGDNKNVDMLVGDIYGKSYDKIGLKSTHIASSFAKVFQDRKNDTNINTTDNVTTTSDIESRNKKFKNEDICKSLLYAVSYNIGQIAYLQAKIHNVKNIYFGGSYIRGHLTTMNTLSYAITFWSENAKQAFFLKHEGYLGAMGAYLKSMQGI
ncbi:hypothetical protein KAFR_0H03730 [Kazachstania africana CBS 2517]|uniref:Pantothenate kinase n=1 Tax=Kazachstania africana (strain ATCC 22294 / BCRC 22015 / CBS 2517 / CECT 1963 / NBRC 1671 / NRRL Y-8276) TaxID=1071382 RepID=H2AYK6_KAZAF|nr:hypothetical protein KAFR_0H03730 [Kazachstania africana CBS 2517]CCF59783.1 hypothetical protein KAFR_0H03730 [Kazachstania africana CBS 2517]